MRCPSCSSYNTTSNRKYKAGTDDSNRKKYAGMNVDRRRYNCHGCQRAFYTIEVSEQDFETNYYSNPVIETKGRIR